MRQSIESQESISCRFVQDKELLQECRLRRRRCPAAVRQAQSTGSLHTVGKASFATALQGGTVLCCAVTRVWPYS